MKMIYCLIAFWVLPAAVLAQGVAFPKFGKPVRSAGELALPKWHVKDSAGGDLNRDQRTDMAVVLEYSDSVVEMRPDSTENTGHPRILVILFQDSATGEYRVACQQNTYLLREGEGGMSPDPYDGITINNNNVLTMNFDFVKGVHAYKFRWQNGDFYLIGATSAWHTASAREYWDYNFSTRRADHTWEDPESTAEHQERRVLKPGPGIKLREIKMANGLDIF